MVRKDVLVFAIFLVVGILLNITVLNNAFLSDDYRSLYRVIIEKRIIYKGLFRPLIDLSVYVNYWISGLNPVSYYIANLLLHIGAAFMVYKVADRFIQLREEPKLEFGIISGFFFLIYPFHYEPVVWITGRLASIACLAALTILYLSMRKPQKPWRYFLLSVFIFFVALTGYESIIFLPFILLVWNRYLYTSHLVSIKLFFGWLLVTLLFLIFRTWLSGELNSEYSGRLFSTHGIKYYFDNFLKVTGRLFLPPMENSRLMQGLFVAVAGIFGLIHIVLRRKINSNYFVIMLCLLIALVLPVMFGISTRTSEGDRLLYFPSVFFCMMLAYLVCSFSFKKTLVIAFASYFLYFSVQNIIQWEKASEAADKIISTVQDNPGKVKKLINVPDELEGAFVFRQGLHEAIRLYGIPPASVVVNNYLSRLEYLQLKDTIVPQWKSGECIIYPKCSISKNSFAGDTLFFYWNKVSLKPLTLTTQ